MGDQSAVSVLQFLSRRVLAYLSGIPLTGLIGAGFFLALSMAPSLIPRDPIIQGVLSGLSAAVGYWLGLTLVWLWKFFELPTLTGGLAKAVRFAVSTVTILLVGFSLWRGAEWQDSLREFLSLESLESSYTPIVLVVAIPLALVLREVERIFTWTAKIISRMLNRIIPRRVSLFMGIILAGLILSNLVSGTIGRLVLQSLDATFLALDQIIDDDLAPPSEDMATGSANSFISWEDLGRQSRRFIVSGPSEADIEDLTGSPGKQPIRVYVGLGAAKTPEERAELAVEEMKRVGAFDRSLLVIATPTGTG